MSDSPPSHLKAVLYKRCSIMCSPSPLILKEEREHGAAKPYYILHVRGCDLLTSIPEAELMHCDSVRAVDSYVAMLQVFYQQCVRCGADKVQSGMIVCLFCDTTVYSHQEFSTDNWIISCCKDYKLTAEARSVLDNPLIRRTGRLDPINCAKWPIVTLENVQGIAQGGGA